MQLDEFLDSIRKLVELYEQGESANVIGPKLGYDYRFVGYVIRYLGLARNRGYYWKGVKNPNWRTPNLDMSPNLAYILGVLYGDGCVDNRNSIRLSVRSRPFAESFAKALTEINLLCSVRDEIRSSRAKWGAGKMFYQVTVMSKKFSDWFKILTFTQIETQLNSHELMNQFIRGMYESEGTLSFIRRTWYQIIIVNTNYSLMVLIKTLLEKLGYGYIGFRSIPRTGKRTIHRLYFAQRAQIDRFMHEVSPVIKRI